MLLMSLTSNQSFQVQNNLKENFINKNSHYHFFPPLKPDLAVHHYDNSTNAIKLGQATMGAHLYAYNDIHINHNEMDC